MIPFYLVMELIDLLAQPLNNCPGKVIEVKGDKEGHWLTVVLIIEVTPLILLNVYVCNGQSKNKILLKQIAGELKALFPTDNMLVSGDFTGLVHPKMNQAIRP